MKKIKMFEIVQPIGSYYMGKMKAKDLIQIKVVKRLFEGQGVQRLLKPDRVKAISLYCTDPDAAFPTPIIIAAQKEDMTQIDENEGIVVFEYNENKKFAEIIDGQHRVEGIQTAAEKDKSLYEIDIPIIVMFDLNQSQKAYVFSTINGNQIPVNPSVIFELFGLADGRSPYKTCHEIARALNSNNNSPFYNRLKMLEKRINETESITQNAFVSNLCELISKNPQKDEILIKKGQELRPDDKLALRKYFIKNNDAVILKILINYFGAIKKAFPNEWDDTSNYILTKTVGFSGAMKALNYIIPLGEKRKQLSESFFYSIIEQFKNDLRNRDMKLIIDDFPSSGGGSQKLAEMIIMAARKTLELY